MASLTECIEMEQKKKLYYPILLNRLRQLSLEREQCIFAIRNEGCNDCQCRVPKNSEDEGLQNDVMSGTSTGTVVLSADKITMNLLLHILQKQRVSISNTHKWALQQNIALCLPLLYKSAFYDQ